MRVAKGLLLCGAFLLTSTAQAAPYQYTFKTVTGEAYTLVGNHDGIGFVELTGMKAGDASSTADIRPVFTNVDESTVAEVSFYFSLCRDLGFAHDPEIFGYSTVVGPISSEGSGYGLDENEPRVFEATASDLPYFDETDPGVVLEVIDCGSAS